ncbi:MAG: alpha-L-fucosidase, partial [Saprospiraceae bacterium]|nr:alpha-L-fucosidase [Saprospiraceae bacterium]
ATPYGKGVIRALSNECKKQGIDLGFYYSICDWHHKDYPVSYPDPGYEFHTEKDITDPMVKAKMDRYIGFMKNQLKELIENFDPTIIWFDGEWEWAWTHEMGMNMYAYLRGLKSDLLINNRVDKGREGMAGTTKSSKFAGDFATPEQRVGNFDNANAWETCMTIASQWAWKANDKMKSKKECIHTLLQTVGGDGNLLFNVGPMADGRIEQRQIDRLKEMGDWLAINGDAVYGTRGGPVKPTDYMVSTRKASKIYLHFLKYPEASLELPFVKGIEVNKAYFLDGNQPIFFSQGKESLEITLPASPPDEIASVIVLELNKPAADIRVIERFRY